MSVNSWKKLISLVALLLIIALLACTIFFGVQTKRLSDENKALTQKLETIQAGQAGSNTPAPDSDAQGGQSAGQPSDTQAEHPAYQDDYPDLYVKNSFSFRDDDKKICYLTFDDGPTPQITDAILDTLKKNEIKATFFVTYADNDAEKALMKRIVDEGHNIAIHTASHNYEKIYASVDAYLADFNKISKQIEEVTGVKATFFRFAGGSINSYNLAIYPQLIAEMTRRGYIYYDWNVYDGDNKADGLSAKAIKRYVLNGISAKKRNIILLHDGPNHQAMAEALPGIIERLDAKGYRFALLDTEVRPMNFGY